jgi:hypothetical protein
MVTLREWKERLNHISGWLEETPPVFQKLSLFLPSRPWDRSLPVKAIKEAFPICLDKLFHKKRNLFIKLDIFEINLDSFQ